MKWYKKYKKLSSILFTYDNSGNKSCVAPPYRSRRNSDYETIDIYGPYGMDKIYKLLGYTENPPFSAGYPSVAIMFEEIDTFEKIWWHYELD